MRVKRTKQNIIHAFIELTKEKNIIAITVQEIAQKAMINRATFYAHYRDKQDLYQQIFNQVIGLFAPCATRGSFSTARSCFPTSRRRSRPCLRTVLKTGT